MYCTEKGFKNKKIEIPTFQRLKCWNANMCKCLITSIYKKYPIGTVTTYLHSVDKSTEKLIIIDGLQRINTIIDMYYKQYEKIYDSKIRFDEDKRMNMMANKYNCYEYLMGIAQYMIDRIHWY